MREARKMMDLDIGKVRGQAGIAARLAAVLGTLFTVATLLPQGSYYGHGARTTYLLFAFWCCAVSAAGGVGSVVTRQRTYIILGLSFLCPLLVTYIWRCDSRENFLYQITSYLTLLMFFAIASYHAQCSPPRWLRMRLWMVLLMGVGLLFSLKTLYEEPKIARHYMDLTTGSMEETNVVDEAAAVRAGIGTYDLYTWLAVVAPCWFALVLRPGMLLRFFLVGAVAVASLAVILSSFTAATVLLLTGLTIMIVALPFFGRQNHRWLLLALSGGAFVALIYGGRSLVEGSGSFEYVVNKAVRLFDGINTAGLVSGDETGRGERFELSAQTFLRHPVFGVGYEEAGRLVGGHSSFVDSWARYGIVGYLPCFLFQVFLTRRVVSNWARGRRDFVAFGSLVCWAIFWVGGILNPVVNSVLPPLLLFTDCWLEKGVRPTGRPGGRENGGKSGFKQKVEKRFR